jgi:hypothetical protein
MQPCSTSWVRCSCGRAVRCLYTTQQQTQCCKLGQQQQQQQRLTVAAAAAASADARRQLRVKPRGALRVGPAQGRVRAFNALIQFIQCIQVCFVSDRLKDARVPGETSGFEWVNEAADGRPKWGFTAMAAGSTLTLQVSTLVERPPAAGAGGGQQGFEVAGSAEPQPQHQRVAVTLGYLFSFERMGVGQVECFGCACDATQFNGHVPGDKSQLRMHEFFVSQHEACRIAVTVLQKTDSMQHKVKIGALIVGEGPGVGNELQSLVVDQSLWPRADGSGEWMQPLS